MTKLLRLLAVLGVLAMVLMPLVAYASYTPPDTAQIEAVRVFRHMIEPNDVLLLARYDVSWGNISDQPTDQTIAQTFEFTYGNSTGTILGNETASPLFNFGYAKGLVAFYWADDD